MSPTGRARSSGSPCTARPPRGGPGSATPPWCPASYLDVVEAAGGQPAAHPAAGAGGRTAVAAVRPVERAPSSAAGGRPRRPGAHRRGRRRCPAATGRPPTRATAGTNRPARRARARSAGRGPRPRPAGAGHLPRACRCSTSHLGGDLVQQLPDLAGLDAPPARPGRLRTDRGDDRAGQHGAAPARGADRGAVQPPSGRRTGWARVWWSRPAATTGSSRRSSCPVTGSWSVCSGTPRRPATPGCSRPWSAAARRSRWPHPDRTDLPRSAMSDVTTVVNPATEAAIAEVAAGRGRGGRCRRGPVRRGRPGLAGGGPGRPGPAAAAVRRPGRGARRGAGPAGDGQRGQAHRRQPGRGGHGGRGPLLLRRGGGQAPGGHRAGGRRRGHDLPRAAGRGGRHRPVELPHRHHLVEGRHRRWPPATPSWSSRPRSPR